MSASARRSTRPSVTFDQTVLVHAVQKVPSQYKHDVWYTKSDYDKILRVCHTLLELKRVGKFHESKGQTFLGLEHLTEARQLQKNVHRRLQLLDVQYSFEKVHPERCCSTARSA
jgi:hypothetical protein